MNEFYEAVRKMRHSQKEYFKSRNYTTIHQALEDERRVDQMLIDLKADAKQMEFNMEDGK